MRSLETKSDAHDLDVFNKWEALSTHLPVENSISSDLFFRCKPEDELY